MDSLKRKVDFNKIFTDIKTFDKESLSQLRKSGFIKSENSLNQMLVQIVVLEPSQRQVNMNK